MKTVLLRYGVVGFLLVYWGFSFANHYFLHESPLSPDFWKTIRLQVLLVTASVVVTQVRLYSCCPEVQQELAGIIVLLIVLIHGLALLLPSLWLFIQWQWDGVCLLQWQDYAFGLMLIVLPAAMFL
ncbi:hypothetical protein EW183_07090 [Salmonella enterica]|uniref:hypothetical protein n=1 Tax=Salmonella enterica TaxID=28901 RepID=UPI000FA4A618|nr:hypothetical protein [Salmonella enterica]ECY3796906.1 hypothetical protein [Salmonella enterica subsp. enterica serovar Minnesota]EDL3543253.1 hypothetical protein [Salmonella enterica subsp. enterica serovar Newport]EAP4732185.1 hypothetical protein [Salmonella enterica]EAQ0409918.1 hypothetical protein [Salmonella enterica]EAR6161162.1 hypothetical protein [Salmonella enterica]